MEFSAVRNLFQQLPQYLAAPRLQALAGAPRPPRRPPAGHGGVPAAKSRVAGAGGDDGDDMNDEPELLSAR